MIRKLSAAVLSCGVIVAAILPTAPASAASSIRLFEAYGQYALGAPNLTAGAAVTETVSGRDVIASPQPSGAVKWLFAADHSLCVAAVDGNEAVVVRDCTGLGTLWTVVAASCGSCFKFKNNRESGLLNHAVYLTGANDGTDLYWAIGGANGGFQVWQEQGP